MNDNQLMKQSAALPSEVDGERLNVVAAEIRMLQGQAKQMAIGYAVEIGRRLTEAKAMVPHGEWEAWLKREVDYSQSTAQNLMRVYRECGDEQVRLFGPSKAQALGGLSYTKVLRILTIPEGPERDEFLETHDVESMSTRELEAALKERDEARLEVERARAEQSAAEQARQKMEQDMALTKRLLETAKSERAVALEAAEDKLEALHASKNEVERLERELAELKNRPVEVVVETDTAAVEAARKEAEERMQAQLNKARKEREKAYDAQKAAEDAMAAARQELEKARQAADRAEKKAALSANEDVLLFRTLFDQVQETVNRLGGVLMKLRGRDPDTAGKLAQAMLALGEKVKGAAQG